MPPGRLRPGLARPVPGHTRDDKGAKIRLGRWLEGQAGRVVGGLRLERDANAHAKQKLWRAGQCR